MDENERITPGASMRTFVNFETKSLDELMELRKIMNITNIVQHRGNDEVIAYLIRMIDLILEKIQ